MSDLPPATAAFSALQHERSYLRQLSLMLSEAKHVVGTLQSLEREPMTKLMKLDLLKVLACHLAHVNRLNEEMQLQVEAGRPA